MTATWYAGVDWGSKTHQVCLMDRGGKVRGERAFPHSGKGLAAMASARTRLQRPDRHRRWKRTPSIPSTPSSSTVSGTAAARCRRDARVLASRRFAPEALNRRNAPDADIVALREVSRARKHAVGRDQLCVSAAWSSDVSAANWRPPPTKLDECVPRSQAPASRLEQGRHQLLRPLLDGLSPDRRRRPDAQDHDPEAATHQEDQGHAPGPSDAAILRSLPGIGTVGLATLLSEADHALAAETTRHCAAKSSITTTTRQRTTQPTTSSRKPLDASKRKGARDRSPPGRRLAPETVGRLNGPPPTTAGRPPARRRMLSRSRVVLAPDAEFDPLPLDVRRHPLRVEALLQALETRGPEDRRP